VLGELLLRRGLPGGPSDRKVRGLELNELRSWWREIKKRAPWRGRTWRGFLDHMEEKEIPLKPSGLELTPALFQGDQELLVM